MEEPPGLRRFVAPERPSAPRGARLGVELPSSATCRDRGEDGGKAGCWGTHSGSADQKDRIEGGTVGAGSMSGVGESDRETRDGVGGRVGKVVDVSPKQPGSKTRRDWYPYYAGFTERFAEAVIDQYLGDAERVLDPWSGSGTTTVTCLRRGLRSRGIDVNPAVTVVARARLNPVSTRPSLLQLGKRIVECASPSPNRDGKPEGELLDQWMTPEAVERIRGFRKAIHEVLEEPDRAGDGGDLGVERLSATACFFYCGLFGAARKLLGRYGTTNPMWLRSQPGARETESDRRPEH